ncbi:hypothetical protein [Streptomyces sp. BP-8]|uniref:Uncharacterized protein n=1 Tax=Streptomyces sirii TaxID=3127701 RepID=A0ABZ2QKF0_9ACTN
MRSSTDGVEAVQAEKRADVPVIALPESFPVEAATLGRQPNNDGDNSCAMWFE